MHSPTGPNYDDLPPTYDEAQQQAMHEARSGATPLDPNDLEIRRLTLSDHQPPPFEPPHTSTNSNTGASQRSRTSLLEDPNAYEFEPENRANARGLGRTVSVQQVEGSERIPVGRTNVPATDLPAYRGTAPAHGSVDTGALLERALEFTRHQPDADARYAPRLARLVAVPQEGVPALHQVERRGHGRRHGRERRESGRGHGPQDTPHIPGQWPDSSSSQILQPEPETSNEPVQFMRAYSKALHAHSIRPAEFTEFLDGLNALCNATRTSPYSLSNSTDDTPPAVVQEYISRANADFFAPRGLSVSLKSLSELVGLLAIPEERGQRAAAVASALDESVTVEKRAQGIHPWVEALEPSVPGPTSRTLVLREMGDRFRSQSASTSENVKNEKKGNDEDDEDPPHSVPDSPPRPSQESFQPFPFGGWGNRGPGVPGVPGVGPPWRRDAHPGRGWGAMGGGPWGPPPHPGHHNNYGCGRRGPGGPGGPGFPFGPRGGPGMPFGPRGFGPGTSNQTNDWNAFGESIGKWGEDLGRSWGKWGEEFGKRAGEWGNDVGKRAGEWGNDVGRQFAAGPGFGPGSQERGQSSSHAYQNTTGAYGAGAQDRRQESGHVYGGGLDENEAAAQESGVLQDYKDRALGVPSPSKEPKKGKEKERAKAKNDDDDDDDDSSSSDSSDDSDSESEDEKESLDDHFLARLREINIAAQASTAKGKKSTQEIALERALAIEKAQNEKTALELKYQQKREKRELKRQLRQRKMEIKREQKRLKRELRALNKDRGKKEGRDKSGKREERRKAREEYREKKREVRKVKDQKRREWREGKRERRRGGCAGGGGVEERAGTMIWVVVGNMD